MISRLVARLRAAFEASQSLIDAEQHKRPDAINLVVDDAAAALE
jgi:hypothetical protein